MIDVISTGGANDCFTFSEVVLKKIYFDRRPREHVVYQNTSQKAC